MATEYRLKLSEDTAPAAIKNGHKVEVEVEGLEGTKVLLLKVNGDLRALSPRCTRVFPPKSIFLFYAFEMGICSSRHAGSF